MNDMEKKIKKAFLFAKKAHEGQIRKGKTDGYIIHPVGVYKILKRLTKDEDVLCAALLHDVIEDTDFNYDNLKNEFGKTVADIVLEVTKDEKKEFNIKTKEGLMVKLADMLHNIHDNKDKEYLKKKINFIKGVDKLKLRCSI